MPEREREREEHNVWNASSYFLGILVSLITGVGRDIGLIVLP